MNDLKSVQNMFCYQIRSRWGFVTNESQSLHVYSFFEFQNYKKGNVDLYIVSNLGSFIYFLADGEVCHPLQLRFMWYAPIYQTALFDNKLQKWTY